MTDIRTYASTLSFVAAAVYLGLGLFAGVFNREYTKGGEFGGIGGSQLGVTHTHLLVLGFIMMLIVVAIDQSLGLNSRLFPWFFWVYTAGMAISMGALFFRGLATVAGTDSGPALSGVAGLGHILLAAGLVIFMVVVGQRLSAQSNTAQRLER